MVDISSSSIAPESRLSAQCNKRTIHRIVNKHWCILELVSNNSLTRRPLFLSLPAFFPYILAAHNQQYILFSGIILRGDKIEQRNFILSKWCIELSMRKVIENEIRWLDFLMKKEKGPLQTTFNWKIFYDFNIFTKLKEKSKTLLIKMYPIQISTIIAT